MFCIHVQTLTDKIQSKLQTTMFRINVINNLHSKTLFLSHHHISIFFNINNTFVILYYILTILYISFLFGVNIKNLLFSCNITNNTKHNVLKIILCFSLNTERQKQSRKKNLMIIFRTILIFLLCYKTFNFQPLELKSI